MTKKDTNLKKVKTGYRAIDVSELERMRQPGYRRINQGLKWNAGPIEKAKYEICKSILHYMQDNGLSEQEIGKKLGIKKQDKLEYLLFCHIDKFTLDKLVDYASELFSPFRLGVIEAEPKESVKSLKKSRSNILVSRKTTNGRLRKHA